jgi:hypothetical protein
MKILTVAILALLLGACAGRSDGFTYGHTIVKCVDRGHC